MRGKLLGNISSNSYPCAIKTIVCVKDDELTSIQPKMPSSEKIFYGVIISLHHSKLFQFTLTFLFFIILMRMNYSSDSKLLVRYTNAKREK